MQTNANGFQLTPQRKRAAQMVAEDLVGDREIAKTVDVHVVTLERWKLNPVFLAAVDEFRAKLLAAIEKQGIANKQNRVDAYNDRWHRLQTVIAARGDELAEIPGGATGLLVRTAKLVKVYNAGGADEDGEVLYSAKRDVLVYEYAVDTALLKELRATEEQAAKELGQWVEKREDKLDAADTFIQALREFGRGNADA